MNKFKNNRHFIVKNFPRIITLSLIILTSTLFSVGCHSTPAEVQDTRTINQLIMHIKKSGLKIDKLMRNVRYQAILASDGVVMVVEGANVEFYLYDMNVDYQREKLLKIKKQGYIKVLGNKVPAITNGRFIMLTYSDNPHKIQSIRAFNNFKQK